MRLGRAEWLSTLVSTNLRKILRNETALKAGIGGDNHLAVVLQPTAPPVRCEDSGVPFSSESCATIERGMEADDEMRYWGSSSRDPALNENLPYELLSSGPFPHSYPIIPKF